MPKQKPEKCKHENCRWTHVDGSRTNYESQLYKMSGDPTDAPVSVECQDCGEVKMIDVSVSIANTVGGE